MAERLDYRRDPGGRAACLLCDYNNDDTAAVASIEDVADRTARQMPRSGTSCGG